MNRRCFVAGIAAVVMVTSIAAAADSPQTAKELLDAAYKRAKVEKKAVFVVFDASW